MSRNFARFLRPLGSFGIPTSLVARGSESLPVTVLGRGLAGQRSVNHGVLTLCSADPWDRGNPYRRRQKRAGEHRRGGAAGCHAQVSGSSDGIRCRKIFPDPDATRRRRNASPRHIFAPSCAMLRRACVHQGPGTRRILQPRQPERQPTGAACPNLAATAGSRSIAPCQFRQDSCRRDWVRFAIFFHRPRAPSARPALSAAIFRPWATAGSARRVSWLAPKRTDGSHSTSRCPA
jgi:hypothetical protein